MPVSYDLKGDLIECCDCFTICPCWVNDKPDEDHCSALYVWKFYKGSTINGQDVEGKSMAAATFHGVGQGVGQAVIYADDTLAEDVRNLLLLAFAGKCDGPLKDLVSIFGEVIDTGIANITAIEDGASWTVKVTVGDTLLAQGSGKAKRLDGRQAAITLNHSALHKELGLHAGEVTVQTMSRYEIAVSPLPGGPFVYAGRSGMRGSFAYRSPKPKASSQRPTARATR